MNKPIFIAEIKTKSPFGFESKYCFKALADYAIKYGDWVSVHTNALWNGSFDALNYVRGLTNKPILAKGIHSKNDEIRKAFEYGADYVLVVDRIIEKDSGGINVDRIIHELGINIQDIPQLYACEPLKYAYNSRNLKTGLPKKLNDYAKYRQAYKWICAASGIRTPKDIQINYSNCDAYIVGENLVDFCQKLL